MKKTKYIKHRCQISYINFNLFFKLKSLNFYSIYFNFIMGNLEHKMASAKSIEQLSLTYKHLQDTRSDSQIQITNKLTQLLSDLNTKRIMSNSSMCAKNKDWSQYVFVCIQGFPALKSQFSMIQLPGETIYFHAINFSEDLLGQSQELRKKYVYQSTFKKQAERLNNLFLGIKKQKIVLVYHSAGNFMLSMYFYYYGLGLANKIKGMIDISGGPLRYYFSARTLVPVILATQFSQIMQNDDKVHKLFIKTISKTGFDLGFKTKYETLSFLHYIKSPNYQDLFQSTWNHPKVLKLLVHGRNDTLFQNSLLNQKAIYYTYRRELDTDYQNKVRNNYESLYKVEKGPVNIQQRFILAIPKGQHSVHNQKRNHQLIRNAVQQYLLVIHE